MCNIHGCKNLDGCKNNPENSFTTKVGEHIPSDFSISAIPSFKSTENKHDLYRGKDSVKKFCNTLREHTVKVISFEKNEVKKLFSFSRYSNFCNFFPSFPQYPDSKGQMKVK